MTLKEAVAKRIPRVRLPKWNLNAYLRLPLLDGGGHGPWAELYDPYGQATLEVPVGSQKICVPIHEDEDCFEVYTGPVCPEEANNYAKLYAEL